MKTIHDAAEKGDAIAVRAFLAAGTPVDQSQEQTGMTALAIACKSSAADVSILKLLIEAGADPNISIQPEPAKPVDYSAMLADPALDPKTRELMESAQKVLSNYTPDVPPLIVKVIREISSEKLQFLMARGLDVKARSPQGYTAFMGATNWDRRDIMEILFAAGASPDGVSRYGESAVGSAFLLGNFKQLEWLLAHGADPAPLGWTELQRIIAAGTVEELSNLICKGVDLEERDRSERTPFLIAVHGGELEKAQLLLNSGSDPRAIGKHGQTALIYAAQKERPEMLRWLLDLGCDPEETDASGATPLREALGHTSIDCSRILLEIEDRKPSQPDFYNEVIRETSSLEIASMLIARGINPALMEIELIHDFIHLKTADDLEITTEEYLEGRFRRFGTANPERIDIPFWRAMVKCGWDAYSAAKEFDDSSYGRGNPVWCHDRFGMSLTPLPDGRFIQIAGEHEDSYDPDFCIYNDVFIHDGHGNFEILAYLEDIFPPTDFHSATLIGEWIYIIGNLGYYGTRGTETPVYRLHTDSGVIEKVTVHGSSPGWIHRHQATLKNGKIHISGGKVVRRKDDGSESFEDNAGEYLFDPEAAAWEPASVPEP